MPPWGSLTPNARQVLPNSGGAFLGNLAGGFTQGRQVYQDRRLADELNTYLDGAGAAPAGPTLGNLAMPPVTPGAMPMGGAAPVGGVTAAPLAPVGTANMPGANAALGAGANAAAPVAGAGSQWAPVFAASEQAYGLPAGLLTRVADRESDFNPNARGAAGEVGMFQFMPGTSAELGVNPSDVAASADGAGRYISQNAAMFGGNLGLGVAGYNWGPGNVQQWLAAGADPNAVPATTRSYVQEVTGRSIEDWLGNQGQAARAPAPVRAPGASQPNASGGPFNPAEMRWLRAMAANPATLGQALELVTAGFSQAAGAGDPFTLSAGETRYDSAGNPIASQPRAPENQPSPIQQYEYAVGQGYQGTFQQFQVEQNQALGGIDPTATEQRYNLLYQNAAAELPTVEATFGALSNLADQVANGVPIAGNFMTTPEYQVGRDALMQIVQMQQYALTGAAATAAETERIMAPLMPVPGDSPERLAQKLARIRNIVQNLQAPAGPGGQVQQPALPVPNMGAQPAPPQQAPAAAAPQGGNFGQRFDPPPPGVDAATWGAMLPEERALWGR